MKHAKHAAPARKRLTPKRILLTLLAAVAALLAAAVVGINVYVHVAFSDFYQEAEKEMAIPGMNSGFVPQDQDYLDAADAWLFSGYSSNGSESPLYKVAADGSVAKFFVNLPDGTPYMDHGSAITTTERYGFLACEGGYLVLDAADLLAAQEGSRVDALDFVALDFTPAFMNIEELDGQPCLFAGNFYFPEDYETPAEHRITTPDGSQNPAVMYAYPAMEDGRYGFAEQALCVFSIPGMIQGMCLLGDSLDQSALEGEGADATAQDDQLKLILSSSYGLSTSHLYAYDLEKLTADDAFMADGQEVDLYYLDSRNLLETFDTPPMAEGIESHDGRVWVSYESASNKYVFGKLYGSGNLYSLPL